MDRAQEAIIIRNFIQYFGKPFTINDVENDTNCNKRIIFKELQQYEMLGTLKSVSNKYNQKIYIRSQKDHFKRLVASNSIYTTNTLDDHLKKKWNFRPSEKTLQLISKHMQMVKTDRVCKIAKRLSISAGTVNRYINVLECIGSVRRGYRIIIWVKDKDIPQIKPYRYYIDQLNTKRAYLNKLDEIIKVIKYIRKLKEQQRISYF